MLLTLRPNLQLYAKVAPWSRGGTRGQNVKKQQKNNNNNKKKKKKKKKNNIKHTEFTLTVMSAFL